MIGVGVIQGLDAEGITGEVAGSVLAIDETHGPHGVEFFEGVGVPFHAGEQGDFGIGAGSRCRGEFFSQGSVVVEFAVVGDGETVLGIGHRLGGVGGGIDDSEAGMGQADGKAVEVLDPSAGIVRPAMAEGHAEAA